MLAEAILSLILATFPPPGASLHSKVRASGPGDRACADDHAPQCRPAWQDDNGAWWRYESAGEAIDRYLVVARALAAEASDADSVRIVLASIHEESHLRRDIHEGSTLGDHGQSYCLAQRKLGRHHPRGRRLVGVDLASTRRCLRVAVRAFERFRRGCHRDPVCMYSLYGGLTSAAGAEHPGIQARVALYGRLRGVKPKPLDEWTRRTLGLDTAPEKACRLW